MHLPAMLMRTMLLTFVISDVMAWGPEGHAVTGVLALRDIDAAAKSALEELLGSTSDTRIGALCNWPDAIRDEAEWSWAAPQHYVNIPRRATSYDASRDCPDGLCVTEAIRKYAAELMDDRLSPARRTQAFAWLCHLVADLHQPLHCGFADDRGGNAVNVFFGNEEINLHQFWDRQLILREAGSKDGLLNVIRDAGRIPANDCWSPHEVNAWTEESHALAGGSAYPSAAQIDEPFAREAWSLIRERLRLAASRLARTLNAIIGNGVVDLEHPPCDSAGAPDRRG